MLYKKPASSILPPLSYRGAGHGGDRHPENGTGAVVFQAGGEYWLDLCRIAESTAPPVAFHDGERYSGASVYPDGSMFEWDGKAYEVMGHDRPGARLWIRPVCGELDLPTTAEPDPEVQTVWGRKIVKKKEGK